MSTMGPQKRYELKSQEENETSTTQVSVEGGPRRVGYNATAVTVHREHGLPVGTNCRYLACNIIIHAH